MNLTIDKVLRYLGSSDNPDLAGKIKAFLDTEKDYYPKSVYGEFSFTGIKNGIRLENGVEFLGKLVTERLRNCNKLLLFSATLGMESERNMYKDSLTMLIADAVKTAFLEDYIDNKYKELAVKYKAKGLFLEPRFSSGYLDFSLSSQMDIYNTLQLNKTLGVSINSSFMLYPNKTVTAIMGVRNYE